MATTWQTVRVFISSTFRDMHSERDHLVTVVFPELRERVEQLGLEFFDVDLRWGVPAKDLNGETANSWEYCRQWIDRVEPFFVCILGQRYGWVPEPQHFRDDADRQRQQREPRSITDLEVRHAVLDARRKRRSYFYLRATTVPEPNAEYVDPPEYQGRLEQLKTAVRQCGRPVRNYSPEWTGQGFVGLKEFGDFVLDDLWSGVLRDERYVPKEVWRQVLNADPDSDPRYTDESQPVPQELWEKLVAFAKPSPKNPLDAEREQMEAFAQTRLRWFQGRTHELQQLTDFIQSTVADAPRLAVVAAVPGQGKSALLAKLSTLIPQPSTFLITDFVGATERSATAHALVERLLGELDRSGIEWPADEQKEGEEPKQALNSLCHRLAKRLGDYAGERRIVILLDALNQFSDGHDLTWLPHRLGPGVRVVVSCVEDAVAKVDSPEQRVLHALASRQPVPLRVPLGPLTEADVRTIVTEYLHEYCKELDTPHVDAICHMEQAKNPLYLLVMLGELRTFGGNDMNRIVGERIEALARDYPDTVCLFRWVLQRLEVFGSEAVRWWCLYLAHGHVGMASHELADLLVRKLGANAAATALLIERGLRRYLLRRGGQLDFFHGQLRQAVMEQYGPHAETTTVHREMADYFTACAKGTDPQKEWETDRVRGFAECVFHFTKAGQHEQAAGLLSNFPFLLHKLRVGLLEGVFEDYGMVQCEAPTEVVRRLEIWANFFREKAHILRRGNEEWPAHKILLQLAIEHADDSPLAIGAEKWLTKDRCNWFWLHRVPRFPHVQKDPCLATLEGHTYSVNGALALADGRLLSWSDDNTLRLWDGRSAACLSTLKGHKGRVSGALALSDGRLLSWSDDETLRLWDGQSGACLSTLKGHKGRVSGALALSDGRLLSWGHRTLRLWDGHSGTCLAILEGHTDWVKCALELANGRLLSWGDGTLRLWEARSGTCLAELGGWHISGVLGALELADGRLLSWSYQDKRLQVWDGRSGACLATLEGHTLYVNGALALGDGRLLSWAWDKTLRLWDGKSGACLATLEGHTDEVDGALELAGGRLLSWSYQDNTLRLWDGQSSALLATMHADWVKGVLALADGRLLSWSHDETLRFWDGRISASQSMLEGHTDWVTGTLALSDGRLLSWAWDKTLRLWDGKSGACLATLEGHTDWGASGALELADGRLLSWGYKTLRLWDSHSGVLLATMEGHTDRINGALELASGRLLSWWYETLQLWDSKSGTQLATLEGHTSEVRCALELADGRLLSWANRMAGDSPEDNTLRIWDGRSGTPLAKLEGHTSSIGGALALADGLILSWSVDKTLRLWNASSGVCLAVLKGHTEGIRGALALADGRLLSWSHDGTLRLWEAQYGACLAVLEGHIDYVGGALELGDGRLLSWSGDKTLRLWHGRSGACLEVVSEHEVPKRHPEWLHSRADADCPERVSLGFFFDSSVRVAQLHHRTSPILIAAWNADSGADARCLLPDGTAVVTQANGQVCFLKLRHGQRRISLAEAEAILPPLRPKP